MKAIHVKAQHIVCACRVPGEKHLICQDFIDDDEHGMGDYLLKILTCSKIQNCVVFVVHNYEGQHIGEERYGAVLEVIKSAVHSAPINKYTGCNDKIKEHEGGDDGNEGAAVCNITLES